VREFVRHPLLTTFEEISREGIPNFFRLYLNPHVAQACYCLSALVAETWHGGPDREEFQTFLANGLVEAIGGAVKLARFARLGQGLASDSLIVGADKRLRNFATLNVGSEGELVLIPGLCEAADPDLKALAYWEDNLGCLVLVAPPKGRALETLALRLAKRPAPKPFVIACAGRSDLRAWQDAWAASPDLAAPDIVVFDESWVHGHVPFAAFTARHALFDHWNRPKYRTFHSTTFQPNTIAALHFVRCLERDDPVRYARLAPRLREIRSNSLAARRALATFYSPALARTITAAGLDDVNLQAAGHFILSGSRRIFDGVAGIASSLRGHNPPTYTRELETLDPHADWHGAVRDRLARLTGLAEMVPAVSGAAAVENALMLGLAAKSPRRHVLAFRGGFGGKTPLALTGTAEPYYKQRIGPLYPNVSYLDPRDDGILDELEAAFHKFPVAVVQLELVQAVGGVRPFPEHVARYLAEARARHGYALFVDEIQTGMYRTGPFTMCEGYGIVPDLMTLGKAASDMMFPLAVTLYSKAIARCCGLAEELRTRADYEFGYRTLWNALARAEEDGISSRAQAAGSRLALALRHELASCPAVAEVRAFGLLVGIELKMSGVLRKWFRKQAPLLYILNLLHHPLFPMLIGYTQYEPGVLKLTPPLTVTDDEIAQICSALRDVLSKPWYRLLGAALAKGMPARVRLPRASVQRKERHEPVAR
jgi:acetylornithine/succinyldiaminopimelate/putrescine aminotransferase